MFRTTDEKRHNYQTQKHAKTKIKSLNQEHKSMNQFCWEKNDEWEVICPRRDYSFKITFNKGFIFLLRK